MKIKDYMLVFGVGLLVGSAIPLHIMISHGFCDALILEHKMNKYYYDEAEADISSMDEGVLRGICSVFDDYTYYLNPEEYIDFVETTDNESFCGIGVLNTVQRSTEDFKILHVYPDSGADDAGLQVGDIIASVDGISLNGMSSDDATDLIRGPKDTTVTIGILRGDDAFEVDVVRKPVAIHDVDAEVLPSGVGYIQIRTFMGTAVENFKEALQIVSDCDNCIIDLRGNTGGQIDILLGIMNQFIPDGLVAKCEYRAFDDEELRTTGGAIFPFKKCIVLVDSGTASCSEVMAGAMRDMGLAKLVGRTTYGKGVIQAVMPFRDSAVKLTIGSYILPSGFDVGLEGITPDYEYTDDDVVDYAVGLFAD